MTIVGKPCSFFLILLSRTCQLRNLADMTTAQADGDISPETRRYSCAYSAKKNLPTGRSRNVGFVLTRSLYQEVESRLR